jgi:hypothetical protein
VIGRGWAAVSVAAALLALAACGEKAQTMHASAGRAQSQPWDAPSPATPGFGAAGWKGGDKAAWEAQIRQRNQAQDDFVR